MQVVSDKWWVMSGGRRAWLAGFLFKMFFFKLGFIIGVNLWIQPMRKKERNNFNNKPMITFRFNLIYYILIWFILWFNWIIWSYCFLVSKRWDVERGTERNSKPNYTFSKILSIIYFISQRSIIMKCVDDEDVDDLGSDTLLNET